MARFNVNAPDGTVIPVDAPDGATEQDAIAFAAATWKPSAPASSSGIPAPRQGFLAKVGTGLASLADTTVGSVLPMAGQVVQAAARPFTTPQRAEELGGAVSSAVEKPFGKAFGVTEQPAYKQEASRQLMDYIGKNFSQGADWIAGKTGIPVEDVRNMMGTATLAVPGAVKTATPVVRNALATTVEAATPVVKNALASARVTPIGKAIEAPLVARAAATQEANVANSYARAPIIDAAQAADRTGLAVNPAITNPTVANKVKGLVVGPAFEDAAAKANAAKTTEIVRKDLGLSSTEPLNAAAVETALNEAGKPYDVVRKMPSLTPNDAIVKSMDELKVPTLIGDEGSAVKVNGLIDKAIESVNEGRSGELIIQDIRQLRKQAQNVYKARDAGSNPSAADVAAADARMGIANSLESLIDANAPNPKVLADIKAARIRMAQIYDHDRAINYANETIDPQAYAKMLNERKGNMSGVGADIGKVAATFPEVMSTQSPTAQVMPAVKRSGLGAAGGALVGGAVGGYPGAIAGATMGGTLGWAGTQGLAKGMTKAEYQAARAIPKDYRNKLAPANNKTNALTKD